MKQKVLTVEIDKIKDLFPNILMNKLELVNVKTIEDILNLSEIEFSKTKTVGKKVVDLLTDYKKRITQEPEYFYDSYIKRTTYIELPSNIDETITTSFLDLFRNSVVEFLNLNNETHLKDIVILGYGINTKKYSRDEIGHLHGYSQERIRQLESILLQKLRDLLSGKKCEEPKAFIKKNVVQLSEKIKTRLQKDPVHSFESIKDCLKIEFQEPIDEPKNNVLRLYLDIINIIPCGNVESNFTDAEIYISDKSIKKDFLKISRIVKDVLKESVLPLNEIDVIIQVRNIYRKADRNLINYALNLLPEIESFETSNEYYFQLKFDKLGNARHYAYRVLSETGKVMYIDEIVSEINNRLSFSASQKLYDRHSLALATDKRFVPLKKTGYWGLRGWDENTDTLEDLIKKVLFKLNKPCSIEEIIHEIHKVRSQAKVKSISALVGKNCLAVEGELFILPEWKSRYERLTFKPKRKRVNTKEPQHHIEIREKIISILKLKQDRKLRANEIIKKITNIDSSIKRPLIYKLFENEKYFIKSNDSSGKLIIELKQKISPTRIAVERYNWQDVKKAYKREIAPIFDSSTQPNYTINIDDALKIFYDLTVFKTAESNLDGLEDRLLPTLEKYFTKSNDRNDKLNYLKQITTSLDAFLKKVLFIINEPDYRFIMNNNKGLNAVIVKLSKLDIDKNRFKDCIDDASDSNFGKFCYLAYSNRNIDAHNAKDWTENEIVQIINACLVFYLYAIFEYETEIKNEI